MSAEAHAAAQPPRAGCDDPGGADAKRRLRGGLISLALLVILVAGLLLAIPGLHSVAHAVEHMDGRWVLAAVVLEVASCIGFVIAFLQVFERAPLRFGARVALTELAFNAAVSLGGAGSVALGAWLLVERGAPVARVAERSAVLFLYTSAINVLTLAFTGLLMFTGVLPGTTDPLLTILPAGVAVAGLVFFLALPRLIDKGAMRRLPARLVTVLSTTSQAIRDTQALLLRPDWRIVGAIAYLWCDIAVLLACFAAAGVDPSVGSVVLAYQIAYVSNLLPVPGGIGVLDGSMVGMLVLYGVQATPATAAVLVYHAISLWVPALWGALAFAMLRRNRQEPLQLRPPRAESRLARRLKREEARRARTAAG